MLNEWVLWDNHFKKLVGWSRSNFKIGTNMLKVQNCTGTISIGLSKFTVLWYIVVFVIKSNFMHPISLLHGRKIMAHRSLGQQQLGGCRYLFLFIREAGPIKAAWGLYNLHDAVASALRGWYPVTHLTYRPTRQNNYISLSHYLNTTLYYARQYAFLEINFVV